MRFGSFTQWLVGLTLIGGCATQRAHQVATNTPTLGDSATPPIAGVWNGTVKEIVAEGLAAGDSREEQQEWHLNQSGGAVSGYYLATFTYTSGDGRPYVCNREPRFSTSVRIEVSGRMRGQFIDLAEVARRKAEGRCSLEERPLTHYRATVRGDLLTLVNASTTQTLHRNAWEGSRPSQEPAPPQASDVSLNSATLAIADTASSNQVAANPLSASLLPRGSSVAPDLSTEGPRASMSVADAHPADVSGVWIWEHRGPAPTGDEKQEREEWHVDQQGDRLSGYYDRTVREISTDGHAFKCSMDMEFEIATRYRIRGEVRGNNVLIFENSFEVLAPSACDNGQRRLDAYEGQATGDEVRLAWGVGAQILHRPRPDVPTQHF